MKHAPVTFRVRLLTRAMMQAGLLDATRAHLIRFGYWHGLG